MTIDHDRARRIADGWASSDKEYPPAGELARAYLDAMSMLVGLGLVPGDLEPHHKALREMRATTRDEAG